MLPLRGIGLLVLSALCGVLLAGCGGAGHSSGGASTPAGTLPAPAFSKTVDLRPVGGKVVVKPPGSASFVPLTGPRQVPVGTLIDVRAGIVRLTAAYPAPGRFAVGDFRAGVFEVRQDRAGQGLTDLKVQNTGSQTGCAGAAHGSIRRLTARQLGLLLADARGSFRTVGQFSAATVRGTAWGVRNRCDGTLTIVRRGVMLVTDFHRHRNVILRAGQSYLARAG